MTTEVRISPNGDLAQSVPPAVRAILPEPERRWLRWGWLGTNLTLTLLRDEDVATWPVLHPDDESDDE